MGFHVPIDCCTPHSLHPLCIPGFNLCSIQWFMCSKKIKSKLLDFLPREQKVPVCSHHSPASSNGCSLCESGQVPVQLAPAEPFHATTPLPASKPVCTCTHVSMNEVNSGPTAWVSVTTAQVCTPPGNFTSPVADELPSVPTPQTLFWLWQRPDCWISCVEKNIWHRQDFVRQLRQPVCGVLLVV